MQDATPASRTASHDLVVVTDASAASLIRSDGSTCRPLVRVPIAGARQSLFAGVLRRFVGANRPRRVLFTVLSGTPYGVVVDPVVTALEQVCDAWHVPLVWLPDVRALAEATRELGASTPDRDSPEPRH